MNRLIRRARPNVTGILLGAAIAGGGIAVASGGGGTTIHGCLEVHTRILLVKPVCTLGQTRLLFSARGPQGPRGVRGPTGKTGAQGTPATRIFGLIAADGTTIHGGVQAGHIGTGDYHVSPQTTPNANCAAVVTPTALDPSGPSQEPIAAVVANHGLGTGGPTGTYQVFITTTAGTPIDDGFSIALYC